MARKRLGELLIEAGAITPEQLDRALREQKEWGSPLGQVLLHLNYIDENGLVRALSSQLNIPVANLEGRRIQPTVLEKVPREFCRDNALIPFNYEPVGTFLDVAMVEPVDLDTLDKIRVMTQSNVRPHFTTYGTLARSLYRYHGIRMNFKAHRARTRSSSHLEGVVLDAREKELEEPGEIPETLTLRSVSQEDLQSLTSADSQPIQRPAPARSPSRPAQPVQARGPSRSSQQGVQNHQEQPAEEAKELAMLRALLQANYQRLTEVEQRLGDLENFLHRDERILRRILGLLRDKRLVTSQDLKRLLDL